MAVTLRDSSLQCRPYDNINSTGLPPSTIFVVEGYNYQGPLTIYRDGQKIVPLQYVWDYKGMVYYVTVASPNGVCGHEWVLETYDFVEPVVHAVTSSELDNSTLMTVDVLRRRMGFNKWSLRC